MKRILIILVLLCTSYAQSQEKTFESEVKKIAHKIELITQQEKDSLKIKIKNINNKLNENKITEKEASLLKKQVALLHATNIENRVGAEELKLQQLVQDKTNGKIASADDDDSFKIKVFNKEFDFTSNTKKNRGMSIRTTGQVVFAMGVNNVLSNNKFNTLNDSQYKFWQSHFYELGFTFKSRLSAKPSKTYVKYGVSFLWNNLRPIDNQYHVINGNTTNLVTFNKSLSESRLRHVQMTFPVHLEFDFSKNRKFSNGKIADRTHRAVRFGIGGFAGFKLGTRQYLEYRENNGAKVEQIQKTGFNTNILNYGISSYISYRTIGLYAKYDLNPLFKNTETRNLALGIRFDIY